MHAADRLESMQRHTRLKTLSLAFLTAVAAVVIAALIAGSLQ